MRKTFQGGFTLVELMIAIAILATLSVLSATSIQQAIKSKAKIQGQIDDVSRMRDALRVMEKDINLAFHYRNIPQEIEELVKKKSKSTKKTPTDPNTPEAPAEPTPLIEAQPEDPSTHFIGTEESLHFVTNNNARMVRNSMMADFIEVGYFLKDCKSSSGAGTSRCLFRRNANYVDQDVTLGGSEFVLLEDISEFSLKYIGKGKQDWVTTWRSDKGGDAATKKNFPSAVQISLAIEKGKDTGKSKKYSMQITAAIHFPNNKEESNEKQNSSSSSSSTIPEQ